jgi:hypothetical protein
MLTRCAWGKNYVYGGDIRIAVGEVCKLPISVNFVFGDCVTQPLSVLVGQVMTKRNSSLLNGKVDYDHKDALL